MSRDVVSILGVRIDRLTLDQAVDRCLEFLRSGRPHLVVTPNSEFLYAAARDPEVRELLNRADLAVADGAGVVLASRILGDPVPEKVAGVELAEGLLRRAPAGTRVFLLGATADSVAAAASRVAERYPHLVVAGYRDGYWRHFDPEADREVIAAVRAAQPQILLCGLGFPKQERWLARYLAQLQVPVCIGVGGTIDAWSGRTPRAPRWMIRANLEWLYRIVRFGRFRRSLPPLAGFLLLVGKERLRRVVRGRPRNG